MEEGGNESFKVIPQGVDDLPAPMSLVEPMILGLVEWRSSLCCIVLCLKR